MSTQPTWPGRSWGIILTAIWLILTGAITLLNLSFQGSGVIMGLIALVAGLLLLVGR